MTLEHGEQLAMHWTDHPHNPFNWPSGKKWMAMLTSCWVTFIVGLNATSITTAAESISEEFNLGNGIFEFNFFAVTAWNAAAAIVPLATLPLMDTYGMRNGYVVSPSILASTASNKCRRRMFFLRSF